MRGKREEVGACWGWAPRRLELLVGAQRVGTQSAGQVGLGHGPVAFSPQEGGHPAGRPAFGGRWGWAAVPGEAVTHRQFSCCVCLSAERWPRGGLVHKWDGGHSPQG